MLHQHSADMVVLTCFQPQSWVDALLLADPVRCKNENSNSVLATPLLLSHVRTICVQYHKLAQPELGSVLDSIICRIAARDC